MAKTIFLTSSLGATEDLEDSKIAAPLDNTSGFLSHLQQYWPKQARVLMLSSAPDATEINDFYQAIYHESFKMSGLDYAGVDVCDRRNDNERMKELHRYDVLILAGGHVPTQNKYFHQLKLKEALKDYSGVIIGVSAGSMNAAESVYAHPELEGEAIDPDFKPYLEGLGLCQINILPHYHEIKEMTLDGFRLIEDLAFRDSAIRPFWVLEDGAYFFLKDNEIILTGEAYWCDRGILIPVTKTNEQINLTKKELNL